MPGPIVGPHHVNALASDPQRNLDLYTEVLARLSSAPTNVPEDFW